MVKFRLLWENIRQGLFFVLFDDYGGIVAAEAE